MKGHEGAKGENESSCTWMAACPGVLAVGAHFFFTWAAGCLFDCLHGFFMAPTAGLFGSREL